MFTDKLVIRSTLITSTISKIESLNLPTPSSELRIGDLTDYRRPLKFDREKYAGIILYDYDSSSTASYLFYVVFDEERPFWNLLIREGVFRCYDIINAGGEFTEIRYPGYVIKIDPAIISRPH